MVALRFLLVLAQLYECGVEVATDGDGRVVDVDYRHLDVVAPDVRERPVACAHIVKEGVAEL